MARPSKTPSQALIADWLSKNYKNTELMAKYRIPKSTFNRWIEDGRLPKSTSDERIEIFTDAIGYFGEEIQQDVSNCGQALRNARKILLAVEEKVRNLDPDTRSVELKTLAETNNAALSTLVKIRELARMDKDDNKENEVVGTVLDMIAGERDGLPSEHSKSTLQ